VLTGCNLPPSDPVVAMQDADAGMVRPLSAEVAETSALACLPSQQFLTLNDSGNPPLLYQLNANGDITATIQTDATNQDWEALAIHQGQLWIADIGNNSGERTTIQLYHAPLPADRRQPMRMKSNTLRYPGPPLVNPSPYQHERDAEALVSTGSQLLLFSKNWLGPQSRVYAADTTQPTSVLTLAGITAPLPGLITDAAFSARHRVFVITGYQNFRQNPLPLLLSGDFSPFLAVLDMQFQLIRSVSLDTGGQLEAICLDEAENIWLSQEKSAQHQAKLWRWGTLEQLLKTTD